jgi:hypothetical protein
MGTLRSTHRPRGPVARYGLIRGADAAHDSSETGAADEDGQAVEARQQRAGMVRGSALRFAGQGACGSLAGLDRQPVLFLELVIERNLSSAFLEAMPKQFVDRIEALAGLEAHRHQRQSRRY